MLRQRLIVTAVFIPIGTLLIVLGGWPLALVAAAGLSIAAWEYWRMFTNNQYAPSLTLIVIGTASLALARHVWNFRYSDLLLTGLILLVMFFQVVAYERGKSERGAQDFAITLCGILYIGWLGSYLISIRALPNGAYWLALVLPAVLFADGAAYFVGILLGRHKLSTRTSPQKSWEGYAGGVIISGLLTALVGALWNQFVPEITPWIGGLLGILIAATSLLGDLGESMIKRSFGVKDSSHIIPGHGGVLDRIDSWLVAAPVGFYFIQMILR